MELKIVGIALILAAVIAVIGAFVWFSYEKPTQEQATPAFHNISLIAYDGKTSQQIQANYTIVQAGKSLSGVTSAEGFVRRQIQTNTSFDVLVGRAGFYTSLQKPVFDYSVPANVRSEHFLYPVGNLSFYSIGVLGQDNPVSAVITAKGLVKESLACLRWSYGFLTVSIENYTVENPPHRLETKVDKCYRVNVTLKDNEDLNLPINYKVYKTLTDKDSIDIVFVYGDISPDSPGRFIFEDSGGNPVLKNDVVFSLKAR